MWEFVITLPVASHENLFLKLYKHGYDAGTGVRGSFPMVNLLEHEGDNSPAYTAKVKNERSYTSFVPGQVQLSLYRNFLVMFWGKVTIMLRMVSALYVEREEDRYMRLRSIMWLWLLLPPCDRFQEGLTPRSLVDHSSFTFWYLLSCFRDVALSCQREVWQIS